MDAKVSTFFISEKIAKIRWVPEPLSDSERFVSGSWDMSTNHVRVWRLCRSQYADDFNEFVPRCSDKVHFDSDITGLEWVTDDVLAASCTAGYVSLMKLNRAVEEDQLTLVQRSPLLHKIDDRETSLPCTGLSVYGKEIATIGEDGRLNVIDTCTLQPRRAISEASSVALTAVAYVSMQEVLIANRLGVISVYDMRVSADTTAVASFTTASEDDKTTNCVSCLTSHPTQPHIVLAGSEEGSITVWDLRRPGFPYSYLSAHKNTISEIAFHRTQTTKLFTASEDGELWLWLQNDTPTRAPNNDVTAQAVDNTSPWLNGERTKAQIQVTSLITDIGKPINTFDSHGSKVICGSDSEAVYFVDSVL